MFEPLSAVPTVCTGSPMPFARKSTSAPRGARRSSRCSPPRRRDRAARTDGPLRGRDSCIRSDRACSGHGFVVAGTTGGRCASAGVSRKLSDAAAAILSDDSMRAASAATVGASKISLNEKSTPKRSRRRESICATVRESAPSAKMSWSTPNLIQLQEFRPCLGQLQLQFRAGRSYFAAAFDARLGASLKLRRPVRRA